MTIKNVEIIGGERITGSEEVRWFQSQVVHPWRSFRESILGEADVHSLLLIQLQSELQLTCQTVGNLFLQKPHFAFTSSWSKLSSGPRWMPLKATPDSRLVGLILTDMERVPQVSRANHRHPDGLPLDSWAPQTLSPLGAMIHSLKTAFWGRFLHVKTMNAMVSTRLL